VSPAGPAPIINTRSTLFPLYIADFDSNRMMEYSGIQEFSSMMECSGMMDFSSMLKSYSTPS
jgi:hypothetical protein